MPCVSRPAPEPVVVSALVLRGPDGRVLTVRKRGTVRFQFPGGKPEAGESPLQTAVRETAEEVGIEVDPGECALLGTFEAPAANEPGRQVISTVFTHPGVHDGQACAEIEEVRWQDPAQHPLPEDLAPLMAGVLPLVARA